MLARIKFLVFKELKDTFTSPMIYVLTALFCFIMGWLFFNYLVSAKELSSVNIKDAVLMPIFGNINFIFIFLSPLLSMKAFSEEKKLFTLDLLLSSNLSETEIIIGKFISTFLSALFLLVFTIVFPLVLSFSGFNDWGLIATSYMGISFSIMCYVAVGVFCSSLTDNQIISSVITFCILLGSMLLVVSVNATNNFIFGQMIQYLSIPFHYEAFTNGVLKSYSFVYYISFLVFYYLLTLKSLQSRKW
jgi:ABC-2 type transport system permease protein